MRKPKSWALHWTRPRKNYSPKTSPPPRRLGGIDNRGSHFYIALYWAEALAAQDDDADLKSEFASIAEQLSANEQKIVDELIGVQKNAVDLGGYYQPDDAKAAAAMRPSATMNDIID